MQAHVKRWDKYILIPTKYACDQGKILSNTFDPFFGSDTCSEGQYADLVQEFLQPEWYIYMTLWDETTLWISIEDHGLKTQWNIVFDNTHVASAVLSITEADNEAYLEYISNSYISLDVVIPPENLEGNIYIGLDRNNDISSAHVDFDYEDDWWNSVDMLLDAQSGNITGYIDMTESDALYFTMSMNGTYSSDRLNLTSEFEVLENPFEIGFDIEYVDEEIEWAECYENYYGEEAFVCYVDVEPSWDTITGEFHIVSNTQFSNNNLDILLDIFLWNAQIVELEMQNRSRRTFKNTIVEKPENTTPYEELFPVEEYDDYYYDEDLDWYY